MRTFRLAGLTIAAAAFPVASATAATPFPQGYDAAYQAFVRALPPAGKKAVWLTKLSGVTSEPKAMTIRGKPAVYLFACKNHSCDTDNVNIFLAPDHKSFRAVLRMGGAQTLLGGAGTAEVSCVSKLEATGGALDAC